MQGKMGYLRDGAGADGVAQRRELDAAAQLLDPVLPLRTASHRPTTRAHVHGTKKYLLSYNIISSTVLSLF
eukprot:COSAG05_NODE_1809_length_4041_cov_4.735921_5_plen_71_part_00